VAENPDTSVGSIRARVQKPWTTINRTLQAFHMLDLLHCDEEKVRRSDKDILERYYSLAEGISLKPLGTLTRNVSTGGKGYR
jgi:hypothetical protein